MASGSEGSAAAFFRPADGRVPRLDHGLERAALVAHVAFDGLDQIRNQVVAARELHVDLRESVTHAVARAHEIVVHRDRVPDEAREDHESDRSFPRKAPYPIRRCENTPPAARAIEKPSVAVFCSCVLRRAAPRAPAGSATPSTSWARAFRSSSGPTTRRAATSSWPRSCASTTASTRDEHLQARQRDLASQRSRGRGADGDRRRAVRARRALARALRRERRRLRHHLRQRRLSLRLPRAAAPDRQRDRGAPRRPSTIGTSCSIARGRRSSSSARACAST